MSILNSAEYKKLRNAPFFKLRMRSANKQECGAGFFLSLKKRKKVSKNSVFFCLALDFNFKN